MAKAAFGRNGINASNASPNAGMGVTLPYIFWLNFRRSALEAPYMLDLLIGLLFVLDGTRGRINIRWFPNEQWWAQMNCFRS